VTPISTGEKNRAVRKVNDLETSTACLFRFDHRSNKYRGARMASSPTLVQEDRLEKTQRMGGGKRDQPVNGVRGDRLLATASSLTGGEKRRKTSGLQGTKSKERVRPG